MYGCLICMVLRTSSLCSDALVFSFGAILSFRLLQLQKNIRQLYQSVHRLLNDQCSLVFHCIIDLHQLSIC